MSHATRKMLRRRDRSAARRAVFRDLRIGREVSVYSLFNFGVTRRHLARFAPILYSCYRKTLQRIMSSAEYNAMPLSVAEVITDVSSRSPIVDL